MGSEFVVMNGFRVNIQSICPSWLDSPHPPGLSSLFHVGVLFDSEVIVLEEEGKKQPECHLEAILS